MNPQYIGYTGCLLLTFTFIPQTYSIIKKEKYDQVNNLFLFLIINTSILMAIYGYFINSYPVIISNVSVFINNIIIILSRCNYEKKIICHFIENV